MCIDRTHKGWLIASLAILGVAILLYGVYRVPVSGGSMGGTALGLTFGIFGFAFMIFAALLGARKKVPVWRVGRAQTWMRGHLWLGLLSLPLVLLHSGFRYGHGLTAVLMTLLIIVVASGIFGAVLQHYMPHVMTREITMETIYEEIGHVRAQLLEEAEELVKQATTEKTKVAAAGVSRINGHCNRGRGRESKHTLTQFFRARTEAVSRKPRCARARPRKRSAIAQRIRADADAGAARTARDPRRS